MHPALRLLQASALPLTLLSLLPLRAAGADKIPAPVEASYVDTKANPGKNFFEYANGAWLKRAKIPADQAQWGSDEELQKRNAEILRRLAETAAKQAALGQAKPGSIEQKVGDFYASGMDEAAINQQRAKPLAPYLSAIDKISDAASLASVIGQMHALGFAPVFSIDGDQDE